MQAVILCGGLATRLGNISKRIPKILLEIGGRTVLDWQLNLLKEAGVKETILASGHLHDMLHEHVGNSHRGAHISYAKEGEETRYRRCDLQRYETDSHISIFCAKWRCAPI